MDTERLSDEEFEFRPVTADRRDDFENLFMNGHPFPGCWCMYWRIKRKDFDRQYGKTNRDAMRKIIEAGEIPGILAYRDGEPVAWCSVAPREVFPVLDRSRNLRRVDETPVWSITCFFVAGPFRGRGMSAILIRAAVSYAASQGAVTVEAYPLIPEKSRSPQYSAFMGFYETFRECGFAEVARRSPMRPIVRLVSESPVLPQSELEFPSR